MPHDLQILVWQPAGLAMPQCIHRAWCLKVTSFLSGPYHNVSSEGGIVHQDLMLHLCRNDVLLCNRLGAHHSKIDKRTKRAKLAWTKYQAGPYFNNLLVTIY